MTKILLNSMTISRFSNTVGTLNILNLNDVSKLHIEHGSFELNQKTISQNYTGQIVGKK